MNDEYEKESEEAEVARPMRAAWEESRQSLAAMEEEMSRAAGEKFLAGLSESNAEGPRLNSKVKGDGGAERREEAKNRRSLTRSRPLTRPSRALGFAEAPFAISQMAQVTAATEGREGSGVAEQQSTFAQRASMKPEGQGVASSEEEITERHIGNFQEKAGSNMKSHEATENHDEVRGVKGEGRPAFAQEASARQARVEISLGKAELGILDFESGRRMGKVRGMKILTLGHSPDPDDAFMFYGLAKELIPSQGFRFEHILQDIQTLNERATRGELDISAVSIHAYAYVCDQYALLPSGASMGDGYGPMLVAKQKFSREEIAGKRIAVPGTMTSAFLALQLWLGKSAKEFNYVVVPFDEIFKAVREGVAEVGLIIHEGQLTYANEGLVVCEDLGVWWGRENGGLPLPLGGNVIHKRHDAATRKVISDILTGSIQFSLDHRAEAVAHALQYARDMGKDLADKFVGMYVNHWTLDYGEKGRESIRRFLKLAHERGLIPRAPELEFVK